MTNERPLVRRETSDYYLVYNRQNDQLMGRLRNLTVAGMMLITSEPLDEGLLFQCRMELTEAIEGCKEVQFDAEVRWCRENEHAGWYEAGFRFVAISEMHAAIIHRLLRTWIAKDAKADAKNRQKNRTEY